MQQSGHFMNRWYWKYCIDLIFCISEHWFAPFSFRLRKAKHHIYKENTFQSTKYTLIQGHRTPMRQPILTHVLHIKASPIDAWGLHDDPLGWWATSHKRLSLSIPIRNVSSLGTSWIDYFGSIWFILICYSSERWFAPRSLRRCKANHQICKENACQTTN